VFNAHRFRSSSSFSSRTLSCHASILSYPLIYFFINDINSKVYLLHAVETSASSGNIAPIDDPYGLLATASAYSVAVALSQSDTS
jgi:hypothetical protein